MLFRSIPFYNEEESVGELVSELNRFVSTQRNLTYEVIFIDDGSTDRSLELLKNNKKFACDMRIIKLSKNFGSHAALRAGIANANGKCITALYADLQDPIEIIPRLHAKIREGNDIVWGFRKRVQENFGRRFFSKIYAHLMRKLALSNFPEEVSDIVMFT